MRYVVDAAQKCLFIYISGILTSWEVGTNAQRVWADKHFRRDYSRLVDVSDVVLEMPYDSHVLKAIGEDTPSDHAVKMALVGPDRLWGSLGKFRGYLKSFRIETFLNVVEAAGWLGVSLPIPWPPEINEDQTDE